MKSKPAKLLTPAVLIDASEFAAMLSISVPTLWGLRSANRLIEPLKLSRTCLRWRRTDIEAWIASLDQQRPEVSAVLCEPTVAADDQDGIGAALCDRREWLAFPGMEG